jgi:lipooligosaccharide transport system ATP-binding protein
MRSDASNDRENVVEASGIIKRYGDLTVVNGIDLTVKAGECFGILGPNGAGKTTTLRMLLGATPPDSGSLRVLGEPIPQRAREARASMGVIPQQDNLDPDFSVIQNLRTYASYFGLKGQAMEARFLELLEFANLESKADTNINNLSGGMKRRLTLARALVNDPALVILDEPTTGLDPQARQLIWQRLRKLVTQGKTLIMTTHYMDEAERLCDRLVIMDQGKVLVQGTPKELVREHSEPHVIEIYGKGLEDWLQQGLSSGRCAETTRLERVGETAFCYTEDEAPLLAALCGQSELHYLHRPANLEDVFLRLTGRDLREA